MLEVKRQAQSPGNRVIRASVIVKGSEEVVELRRRGRNKVNEQATAAFRDVGSWEPSTCSPRANNAAMVIADTAFHVTICKIE